jgi:N-acetylneuraminate synthase
MIELARHAVAAGADAVKVQCHFDQALHMQSDGSFPPWFQGPHNLETRQNYLLRQDGFVAAMKMHGPQVPIILSPFHVEAVEERYDGEYQPLPDAWKVASGQVTNHALIRAMVATGKPIIVSSGMTTWEETWAAIRLVPLEQRFCVMECTSEYPCPPEHVGLYVADDPDDAESLLDSRRGFSDHTAPDSAAAAVIAWERGARVFERHVCFDQRMYGSDAKNASTLEQFAHYCRELDRASRIPTGDVRDANAERLRDVREQFLVRSE